MLLLFERVAGIAPYTEGKPDESLLGEFCQVLVDYIATGHFGLYERIAEGKERRQRVVGLAGEMYPRIIQTTDMALAFNDGYDVSRKSDNFILLLSAIPKLGEELALRIELEDRLIEAMK